MGLLGQEEETVKLTTVAAGLLLTLTGCTQAPPDPMANVTDLPSLATLIGCQDYRDDTANGMVLTKEYGTCRLAHGDAQLYRLASPASVSTFWVLSKSMGGMSPQYAAESGPFVVAPADSSDLPAVKAAMGL
jgi:hypothetical protein